MLQQMLCRNFETLEKNDPKFLQVCKLFQNKVLNHCGRSIKKVHKISPKNKYTHKYPLFGVCKSSETTSMKNVDTLLKPSLESQLMKVGIVKPVVEKILNYASLSMINDKHGRLMVLHSQPIYLFTSYNCPDTVIYVLICGVNPNKKYEHRALHGNGFHSKGSMFGPVSRYYVSNKDLEPIYLVELVGKT